MDRRIVVAVASLILLASCEGPPGPAGKDGANGASCSVVDNGDGTKTITCADGTRATVNDGAPGSNGSACSVTSNADGTRTISCSDGTKATVSNGKDGASCTVAENGNGTRTISCSDGTSVTLNDGQNGTDGQNGQNGQNGTSCTVTAEPDGSTLVACTDGTFTRVSPPINTRVDPEDDLPGLVLTILHVDGASRADGTFAPGDVPSVTFTLTTATGEAVPLDDLHTFEAWLSGPTSNYQHLIPSTRDRATLTDVAANAVQNEDGTFTYTFAQPIPSTYGVPLNDTAKFSDGELSGALLAGTYTLAMNVSKTYSVGSANVDDVGSDIAQLLLNGAASVEPREVVTTANCNQCHTKLQFHAGLYRNTTLCATCHTAGAEDNGSTDTNDATPQTIELKVMIHKLHDGAHLPSVNGIATNADGSRNYGATPVPYIIGGDDPKDFSDVGFPVVPSMTTPMPRRAGYSALSTSQRAQDDAMRQGVVACEKCHGDPDASVGGGPLAAPAQGANFSTQPSRRACQSCHDDVDFTKPYDANLREMPPEANDNACTLCHTAAGSDLSIVDAHRHPQSIEGSPPNKFQVTSVSGGSGANGNFVVGDAPSITFTLKDGNGADIAPFALDTITTLFVGPTTNRQIVTPYPSPNGVSYSLVDFSGRLASSSASNKGLMSKVVSAGSANTTSDTLVVQFTSPTAFNVTGRATGTVGAGALSASTSTNPSGSSISNIQLTSAAPAHQIAVAFLSSTDFTVLDAGSSIGVGHFSASTNASTHFVSNDGSIAFNVAVGATAFAPNNNIVFTIFSGTSSSSTGANPVLFAITAGRTAFSTGDRFYYDYLAPAASYTMHVPMELPLEALGHADGSANPVLTAGNAPVDFGRQTLFERTALVGTASNLVAANSPLDRIINLASIDPAIAINDNVVIDDGTAVEEYVQVGALDAANKRVTAKTPLRFAHASGATLQKATLAFRQEGSAYTLDPIAGTVTLAAPSTNAFVMTYRSDARFGWHRKAGDVLQTTYAPPMNDSPDLDETWGDWSGKSYVGGTYTIALYGNRNLDVGLHGEVQTYRAEEDASLADFLFGNATTLQPYNLVSSGNNCQACHSDLSFHGGSRRGPDVCFTCHDVAGAEDWPQYNATPSAAATPGATINFRTMLHKIHRGSSLAQADTYAIVGFNGSASTFGEIEFPAMPKGVMACTKCHGTSDVFQQPTDRNHPTQQGKPVRAYRATCGACHDGDAAQAHIEQMTSSEGVESCETCHGIGKEYAVEVVHKTH